MDTVLVFCALLGLALFLSFTVKLFVVARNWLHLRLTQKERDMYEERFARLAADALASEQSLLLTDQRNSANPG